jgi:uncharacterized membrane protein YhiD involved in acid resistance
METVRQLFEENFAMRGNFSPEGVILSLLLAFILGQIFAWVYYATHSGLSYSRTFVQSLILLTIVVSLVMAVIGNSIITAFGLMGALAIIRFRNVLKDTRDMVFIFSALVVGMACGSQRFDVAILGTVFLCLVAVYLHLASFGAHQPHNGFLRFQLTMETGAEPSVRNVTDILKRFCRSFKLISVQGASFGAAAEYSYQLMIKKHERNEEMLYELEKIENVGNINLTMQEELLEV